MLYLRRKITILMIINSTGSLLVTVSIIFFMFYIKSSN